MFLWNFSEIVKKFEETWGILNINLLIFWWKLCDIFSSIFGKTNEKLLEKYDKKFMISFVFKNAVTALCIVTVLNISTLQICWRLNFYSDAKTQE